MNAWIIIQAITGTFYNIAGGISGCFIIAEHLQKRQKPPSGSEQSDEPSTETPSGSKQSDEPSTKTLKREETRAKWHKTVKVLAYIAASIIIGSVIYYRLVTALSSPRSEGAPAQSVASTPTAAVTATPALPVSECVDRQGNDVACAASGAGLVTEIDSCSTDAFLRTLALTPTPQVDLSAEQIHERCVLFPGEQATSTGASAIDIKALQDGEKASMLRSCLAANEGNEVPCSQPHFIEYVGPWTAPNNSPSDRSAECDMKAREYTKSTFTQYDNPLKVVLLSRADDGFYRCGVESSKQLSESLWWTP